MVNSISLNAYSYNGILSGTGSKLYVPVSPASVIYAQFDHISGVAATPRQSGISLSKMQILNSLLNQLITMKAKNADGFSAVKNENAKIDESHAELLIKNYQRQVQESVEFAREIGYGLAGASPQAGILFDLSA